MKNWALRNRWVLVGALLGAVAGFIYWQQIACNSGTCMITSTWHNSTAYGAVIGGLFFSLFQNEKKKSHE